MEEPCRCSCKSHPRPLSPSQRTTSSHCHWSHPYTQRSSNRNVPYNSPSWSSCWERYKCWNSTKIQADKMKQLTLNCTCSDYASSKTVRHHRLTKTRSLLPSLDTKVPWRKYHRGIPCSTQSSTRNEFIAAEEFGLMKEYGYFCFCQLLWKNEINLHFCDSHTHHFTFKYSQ